MSDAPTRIHIEPSRPASPRFSRPVAALTIAGSDSGGGAGIQADLRVFAAHGLLGCSAITAITAQNTLGVRAWEPVSEHLVQAQIDAVLYDLPVTAMKTGMLGRAGLVRAVAASLVRGGRRLPLVVDPVMVSTSGHRLLERDAEAALVDHIIPLATVLTPNLHEAAALSGLPLSAPPSDHLAALAAMAPQAFIIVKGGHRAGDVAATSAVDLVRSPSGKVVELVAPWVETTSTHGTGCSFSAAIASRLALSESGSVREEDVMAGIVEARRYLAGALESAVP
ncbi:MAG TPA: bifunctional hydroxymethylpyrimidine kinase/phosphomethylpyrimidine kinase, partial [Myxococcota bacterium]|nr:bifunctional hydroxymethylpyrimidine kinase/phosphomethylpyrimidine kinase [Myxococcota bacterium]